jgi:pimeloyl-ACP methyl ester carboxylesterase
MSAEASATAMPATVPPGRMVELPGRDPLWVHEGGDPQRPTLMLLHGLGASAALNWGAAFPALQPRFHVVAPDHRGHGRTPPGRDAFSLESCAEDVVALADVLGVDRFVAVGYSMGGPIAQLVWRRAPDRVRGLVLAATSRDFRGGVRDRLRFQTVPVALAATRLPGAGLVRDLVVSLVAPRLAPDVRDWAVSEMRAADPRRVLEAAGELGRFTSREWIGGVSVPTSVIVTMEDQLVPVRRQLKLARAIDGAVATFVAGDHYTVGTVPDAFVPVLLHECARVVACGSTDDAPAYWNYVA